jgi:hypothetical protein
MRRWFLLLTSLVGATSVADVVSDVVEDTELTIYRDNGRGVEPLSLDGYSSGIAMITETRTIEIPAGQSTIQFRGVADGIVPQTAALEGVPATIVEANYDYNLLAPGTLLAKSLGRQVTFIRTNPYNGEVEERRGTLRSGPQGVVVDFGGEFEALNCSGLHERLVFTDIPDSLTDTPTLSMTIRASTAGKYQVQLSYLALNMDWSADYTARIHPDGRHMDVSAWVTLLNRNGSGFSNARTHVVAGTLARDEEETQAPEVELPIQTDECWPYGDFRLREMVRQGFAERAIPSPVRYYIAMDDLSEIVVTAAKAARASELGDYKLYTLPFATTVAPMQLKQARLLDREDVQFERVYQYRITEDTIDDDDLAPVPARSVLRIKNTKSTGLGLPLPAGTWRVMEIVGDGREYFVGEQAVEDTPIDLPRDLELGAANDISVTTQITEGESWLGKEYGDIDIEVGNAGDSAADVEILLRPTDFDNGRIVKESRRHHLKDGDHVWALRVAPNKRSNLRLRMMLTDDLDRDD